MNKRVATPTEIAVTLPSDGALLIKVKRMEELRDRITRVETRQEALKENFTAFATEVKAEYRKLAEDINGIKVQLVKLIIVTTLLAQGAGQLIGPLAKTFLGQ